MTEEMKTEENGLAVVGEGVDLETYQKERDEVLKLRSNVDEHYSAFAEKLAEIYNKDMYRNWGYDRWQDYVDKELDFDVRKAQYLVKIQGWLAKMSPEIREFMHALGWTKTRMLMHVINQDNFNTWRNRIEGKTVAEIEAILKADKDEDDGSGDGGGDGSGEGGGESGERERRKRFSFSCVGNQIPVCEGAIARAMELAETDNQNQAFNMICLEFQGSHTTDLSENDYLRGMEKALGLKLIAMRTSKDGKDEVVFGEEYIPEDDDSSEESAE